MNTLDTIYQRRSIKQFDPEHVISKTEINLLLEATIQSPSSFNVQHWRFVLLEDKSIRRHIREHFGNQAQITDASLLVLFTADTQAWQKSPERYFSSAPADISNLLLQNLQQFYQNREWLQRDEAQRSIGMAMQTLMLAAKDMGYDSCPMIGFDIEGISEYIRLPKDYVLGPMVAIGKAIAAPWPKSGQLPLDEIVIENCFPHQS